MRLMKKFHTNRKLMKLIIYVTKSQSLATYFAKTWRQMSFSNLIIPRSAFTQTFPNQNKFLIQNLTLDTSNASTPLASWHLCQEQRKKSFFCVVSRSWHWRFIHVHSTRRRSGFIFVKKFRWIIERDTAGMFELLWLLMTRLVSPNGSFFSVAWATV